MKISGIILILAMTLSGCHKNNHGPTNSNATQKVQIQSNQTFSCQITIDPYSCQKQACQNAGAKYDDKKNICECSEGQIFSSKNGGECLNAISTDNDGDSTLIFKGTNFYVNNYANTLINSIIKRSSIPITINRSILYIFDNAENMVKNPAIKHLTKLKKIHHLGLPNTDISPTNGNAANASGSFGEATFSFIILPTNKPVIINSKNVSDLINDGIDSIVNNQLTKKISESYDHLGCASICIEKSLFPQLELKNTSMYLERIRVFSGGNPIKDTLLVFDKTLKMYTAMVILINEEPSYGYSVNQDGDVYFEDLLGHKLEFIANILGNKSTFQNISGTPVAIFEDLYSEILNQAVMPGKFQNSHYYGYFDEKIQRPFFYGHKQAMFAEEDMVGGSHTISVANIASSNLKKPILPFPILSLRNGDFLEGLKSLTLQKFVANASFAVTRSYESCKNGHIGKQINITQKSVLWTIAAANDGQRIEHPKDLLFCPQSLQGPNIMIVASTEDGIHIASSSSYGRHYADIIELGCEQGKENCVNEGGTSFAAPRLARKAADLMELFPELSPEQIKLALMITAKPKLQSFNKNIFDQINMKRQEYAANFIQFYDVRSGGIADLKTAIKFLEVLKSKNSFNSFTSSQHLSKEALDALIAAKLIQYTDNFKDFDDLADKQTKTEITEELINLQLDYMNKD